MSVTMILRMATEITLLASSLFIGPLAAQNAGFHGEILALAWVIGIVAAALTLETSPRLLCTERNANYVQRCTFATCLIGSFVPAVDEQYGQGLAILILCQLSLGLCSGPQLLLNSQLPQKRRSDFWIYIIVTGSIILWANPAIQDIKGWAGIEHGSYFFGMLASIPSRSTFDFSDSSSAQREETTTGWRRGAWPILVSSAVCIFANLNPPSVSNFPLDVYSQVTLILVNRIWRSPKLFATLFACMFCLLCTYILVTAKSYLEEVHWPLSLAVDLLFFFSGTRSLDLCLIRGNALISTKIRILFLLALPLTIHSVDYRVSSSLLLWLSQWTSSIGRCNLAQDMLQEHFIHPVRPLESINLFLLLAPTVPNFVRWISIMQDTAKIGQQV